MTEMKPCPFCGGKPYTEYTRIDYNGLQCGYEVILGCITDGIRMKGTSMDSMDSAYKRAVKRWNRRVE